MLADEEKNTPGRSAPKNAKSAQKKTKGLDLSQLDIDGPLGALNASGIDNALDALSITNTDNKVKIDRHPERRIGRAWKEYVARVEREWEADGSLKERKKYRGAMHDDLEKMWPRAPENPMNQVSASYNATEEEIAEIRAQQKKKVENRLAEK